MLIVYTGPSPTPSAKPSLNITVDNVSATAAPDEPCCETEYRVIGNIINKTSSAISIEGLGFYVGAVDESNPPADSTFNEYKMVEAKSSVPYTEKFIYSKGISQITGNHNTVTATFNFPDNKGEEPYSHLRWQ